MSTKRLHELLDGLEKKGGTIANDAREARRELDSLETAALNLREVAFDGPSEVKGAPGGESFWNWKRRIDIQTRWLSSVPGMESTT